MRVPLILSVSALAATGAWASADEHHPPENDVLDLSAQNFTTTIQSSELILVEFMAPWCGHCKALMPEYIHAASVLKPLSIPLAKVDCTAEGDLCSEHGIQGYPTLKVFANGVSSDYSGPRKADGIISFMKKRSRPVVSTITPSNHTEFIKSDRVVIVAYLEESDTASLEAFRAFGETKRDDYAFGVVYDTTKIPEVASISKPGIVLWKQFDEGRNDLHDQHLTKEKIAEFVAANALPLIDEVSASNFGLYVDLQLPLAYLFIEGNNPERESIIKSIEPVAREHKGKISFVWIDATKFADHAKTLGLGTNEWPAFVIQEIQAQNKFPLNNKAVDSKNIAEFVRHYRSGTLTPSLKSQPVPKKQGSGAYTLVADEFDKVVYASDNQKDVFIEFYAPWCGHCKRLKPTWDNLAHSFKGVSDKVVIAKFDSTENDIPSSAGISVAGFPTLKFKPAKSKEFIDYEGDRSLDSLIEFVEQNSANRVKAVKVELPEEPEFDAAAEQVVMEDTGPPAGDEDADAEHDEL